MTVRSEDREAVRAKAGAACEFCGVHENEVGGLLTIDHYRPRSKGGSDDLSNLIYCCTRCNQYKLDYWPAKPEDPSLWNPRERLFVEHFLIPDWPLSKRI